MTKKVIIGLACLALFGIGGSIAYSAFTSNTNQKQDVTNLKVTSGTKSNNKKSKETSGSTTVESTENTTDKSTDTIESKPANTNIPDNIDTIKALVVKINDFSNASLKAYGTLADQFSNYNINLDDTVKGPYGIFDPISDGASQEAVLAGIVTDSTVEEQSDGYLFTNTARTGQGPMNVSAVKTGTIIRKALAGDEYKDVEKQVQYKLELNEDKTSGTLRLVSGQWW